MRATDAASPIELIDRVLGFDFLDLSIYTAGIAATPQHRHDGIELSMRDHGWHRLFQSIRDRAHRLGRDHRTAR
jgi:hypothetical protein